MAAARRLDPEAVTRRLRRHFERHRGGWLEGRGDWPLEVPLHPPTEREAGRDLAGVRAWIAEWQGWRGPGEVVWTERAWASLGRQRVPERLRLQAPEQIGDWVGEGERWRRALGRAERIAAEFPALAGHLGRHFDWLADSLDTELERLTAVLAELSRGVAAGLYVRQLPIAGVDTKWINANRARVTELLRALLDAPADRDLWSLTGLRREAPLLRLRLLDPALRQKVGGLEDLTAPVEQLAALALHPARVFIVENLQTGLAFTDLPGSVVFMGQGYAVECFGQIPWLRGAACWYWGDLDTHGLAILDRLRRYLPEARSLMMDEAILMAHRALWTIEARPRQEETLARLTAEERAVYEALTEDRWGKGVRLEQERIEWGGAWRKVRETSDR
ncbi:hypothetical protein Thimo_1288 [Thioflavicoccus mobilis 8321]|uniref:DUF3322 and DUF2220 domain-containing protein n=1 Tax=Thioflavicoccus mobilis 8321 TaxID=765912 RepID=L0GXI2_9GAMM|nr:Wadjet anti-phage system protein JetD domain-containing protein [Thioflavicoccus mobilis]AGA90085.1 hypothetical protein Thimo_1288 [Thioflavicoccus mobilis 8321]